MFGWQRATHASIIKFGVTLRSGRLLFQPEVRRGVRIGPVCAAQQTEYGGEDSPTSCRQTQHETTALFSARLSSALNDWGCTTVVVPAWALGRRQAWQSACSLSLQDHLHLQQCRCTYILPRPLSSCLGARATLSENSDRLLVLLHHGKVRRDRAIGSLFADLNRKERALYCVYSYS